MFIAECSRSEGNQTVMPEQKTVASIKNPMSTLPNPRRVLVGHDAGLSARARPCTPLPKHCQFIQCKTDSDIFHALQLLVVEMFVGQMLNDKSDLSKPAEVRIAAMVLLEATDGKNVKVGK